MTHGCQPGPSKSASASNPVNTIRIDAMVFSLAKFRCRHQPNTHLEP